MKIVRLASLASLLGLLSTSAFSQAGAGKPPLAASGPTSAAPAGSAPYSGMGRMGPRGGHRAGPWGADTTPGWALMNDEERKQHQERMRAMKTYDECRSYMDQHHAQMTARAAERGGHMPAQPRRDACAGLKK